MHRDRSTHPSMHRERSTMQPLSRDEATILADGLGWFSIALGAAELVAPHRVARALGLRGREETIALCGLREIVTGVGILAARNKAPWLWGRVAGDAIDAVALAPALQRGNPQRQNAGSAMMAVAAVTLLDIVAAQSLAGSRREAEEHRRRVRRRMGDYAGRSGLPRPPEVMRGAAADFEVPADMRTPEALRPWTDDRRHAAQAH